MITESEIQFSNDSKTLIQIKDLINPSERGRIFEIYVNLNHLKQAIAKISYPEKNLMTKYIDVFDYSR